jgi:hypothetical protein
MLFNGCLKRCRRLRISIATLQDRTLRGDERSVTFPPGLSHGGPQARAPVDRNGASALQGVVRLSKASPELLAMSGLV